MKFWEKGAMREFAQLVEVAIDWEPRLRWQELYFFRKTGRKKQADRKKSVRKKIVHVTKGRYKRK